MKRYPEAMAPITQDHLVREYVDPGTGCIVARFEVDGMVEEFAYKCRGGIPEIELYEYYRSLKEWLNLVKIRRSRDIIKRQVIRQRWPVLDDRLNWLGICKKVLRRIFV